MDDRKRRKSVAVHARRQSIENIPVVVHRRSSIQPSNFADGRRSSVYMVPNPNDPDKTSDIEGSLSKESMSKEGTWHKRYFVLRKEGNSPVLEYYPNHIACVIGLPPKQSFYILPQSTVKSGGKDGEDKTKSGFLFQFRVNRDDPIGRLYTLAADSAKQREKWMDAIALAIHQAPANPTSGKSNGQVIPQPDPSKPGTKPGEIVRMESLTQILNYSQKDLKARPPQQQEAIKAAESVLSTFVQYDNPANHFEFATMRRIGRGAFGQVYVGTRIGDLKLVAVKIIKRKPTTNIGKILNEVAMMTMSRGNDNVVQCLGCFVTTVAVWVIQEYMHGGDLTGLLSTKFQYFDEPHIAYVCQEVLKALSYLHSNFRIHRDLKSDNVLIGLDGSIKLGDFGIAAQLTDEVCRRGSQVGTPAWMAPEVARRELYNEKADVWSFGILVLEMTDKQPPLLGLKKEVVLQKIIDDPAPTLKNPKFWSSDLQNFVSRCLVKDPEARASVDELLAHPFIKRACHKSKFSALVAQPKGRRGSIGM